MASTHRPAHPRAAPSPATGRRAGSAPATPGRHPGAAPAHPPPVRAGDRRRAAREPWSPSRAGEPAAGPTGGHESPRRAAGFRHRSRARSGRPEQRCSPAAPSAMVAGVRPQTEMIDVPSPMRDVRAASSARMISESCVQPSATSTRSSPTSSAWPARLGDHIGPGLEGSEPDTDAHGRKPEPSGGAQSTAYRDIDTDAVTVSGSGRSASRSSTLCSSTCQALGPMRTSWAASSRARNIEYSMVRRSSSVKCEPSCVVEAVGLVVGHREQAERPDELVEVAGRRRDGDQHPAGREDARHLGRVARREDAQDQRGDAVAQRKLAARRPRPRRRRGDGRAPRAAAPRSRYRGQGRRARAARRARARGSGRCPRRCRAPRRARSPSPPPSRAPRSSRR